MSNPNSKRSVGQWIVGLLFGLLAAAFLLRSVLFGYKWLRHVVEGSANFKALTIWTLVYAVVCAAIARVAFYSSHMTNDGALPTDSSTKP